MRMVMLTGVLLMTALPTMAAEPKDVIEAAIKAHGGKEALAKHPGYRFEFEMDASAFVKDAVAKGTKVWADGGRIRTDATFEGVDTKWSTTQVSNGKKAYTIRTFAGEKDVDLFEDMTDTLKIASLLYEASKIYPLLDDKRFTLRPGADADLNGKKASVVVVTFKEFSKEVMHYFDQASGLLVKQVRKVPAPDGDIIHETEFTDFKEIDGVHVATKQIAFASGKKFMTLSGFKFLDKIDDSLFNLDK
jgi:hypothetical protein